MFIVDPQHTQDDLVSIANDKDGVLDAHFFHKDDKVLALFGDKSVGVYEV